MRREYDSELWVENGEIIGINLGADFVSEHEWGIEGIERLLGIEKNKKGISRYKITQSPKITFETENACSIFTLDIPTFFSDEKETAFDLLERYRIRVDEKIVSCAWDSKNFLIHTSDTKVKGFLSKLKESFSNKDVVVFVGGMSAFKNGGLALAIESKIPQKFKNDILERHNDSERLSEYFNETGIEDILSKASKRYMALSPRWDRDEEVDNSEYKIICWLNPHDQQNNNYGWYTIEELLDWAKDKGPIPMKKG